MTLFSDEDDPFEKAEKMRYIENACEAAKVIMEEAEKDEVLFDLITVWNEPKKVSYEMTILARHDMLKDEE
jgi:hypothetical protein